jgi:hypothetical protein
VWSTAHHERGFCCLLSPGIKRSLVWSSLRRQFAHEEKITMAPKITMPLIAVVMVLTLPAPAPSNRGNASIYQSAQFCVPQHDELSGMTRIYC